LASQHKPSLTILRQLLYQPFTPYFVLFANVISNPTCPECFKDLKLLRQVVLYFLQMHNNHPSARKLEKIAETFTRLAEAYVRQSMEPQQRASSIANLPSETGKAAEQISAFSTPLTRSSNSETAPSLTFDEASQFSSMPSFTTSEHSLPTEFDFNDHSSDPMALLNFFSISNGDNSQTPEGLGAQSTMNVPTNAVPAEFSEAIGWPSDPLMRELKSVGENPGLDWTFDWFSWEQYDTAMG
jgi:hypothetical protein